RPRADRPCATPPGPGAARRRRATSAGRAGRRRGGGRPRTRGNTPRANGPGRCEGIARAGPWSSRGRSQRPGVRKTGLRGESGAQALAALGTTTRQDLAAIGGLHAGTEAVVALALEVAGLEGALGGHGGTRFGNGAKELESVGSAGTSVKFACMPPAPGRARPCGCPVD